METAYRKMAAFLIKQACVDADEAYKRCSKKWCVDIRRFDCASTENDKKKNKVLFAAMSFAIAPSAGRYNSALETMTSGTVSTQHR